MFSQSFRRIVQSVPKRSALRCMHTLGYGKASNAALSSIAFISLTGVAVGMHRNELTLCKRNEPLPSHGIPGTAYERTFIAIKPDGVQRGLVHEVIARFEKKGYKLVGMRMMTASEQRAREHYADLSSRPFFPGLVEYFTSGPIVIMVWEGTDVIATGRKILGATNPNDALPGTLRGDNCISTGRNLVHGSDGPDSAKHEISMWFSSEELQAYERALDVWIVAQN